MKNSIAVNLSLGRARPENEEKELIFLQDRQRITCSSAFRRLEHKTQVFINHPKDHYRTRLTHSLEVACIAKYVARKLRVDEDLAEAIALAHDLGHPPFGHAGEEGLAAAMHSFGGFNHNLHTLKIVGMLEKSVHTERGLNLSYEVIEGLAKHNGPVLAESTLFVAIQELFPEFDLQLAKQAHLEAQIASLADDIAYCTHDLEDGLRAEFFTMQDIMHVPIIVRSACGASRSIDLLHNLREFMISDLLEETQRNILKYKLSSVQHVREQQEESVRFSAAVNEQKNELKQFLMEHVYRHHKINRIRHKVQQLIYDLFHRFMEVPDCLPRSWYIKIQDSSLPGKATVIGDYIAGMTDRFALLEYRRVFDPLNMSNTFLQI